MSDSLESLEQNALAEINAAASTKALDDVRVAWLGKKGALTEQLKSLGGMAPEERKAHGAAVNAVKGKLEDALAARKAALEAQELAAQLANETCDMTLPTRAQSSGAIHPITQTLDEITSLFAQMGFEVAEGPDIEDDEHNFTRLNFPADHPARLMHDTFFLNGKDESGQPLLLRTHTSPVQIRRMLEQGAPLRIIMPGTTYRCDSDATHTPMFHQVEGLVIGKDIHMGHLKYTLETFLKSFFALAEVPLRFRPSFFPFTEPSAEVDIACTRTAEKVILGEGSGWMEILGCGMVHPNVLKHGGINPDEYQGFAFGIGIERLAMLKYGIPDLRAFFDSDVRWLQHYGFSALNIPTPEWEAA